MKSNVLTKIFAINQNLCQRLNPFLSIDKKDKSLLFQEIMAEFMNAKCDQIIIDLGAGKSTFFAEQKNPYMNAIIVGVDISGEELKRNRDVDEKVIADVAQGLPFSDEGIDIIASQYLLEHIENLEKIMVESKRVLKKNGYFIHLFPSKFAPFAIINQLMPKKISRRKINYFLYPEKESIGGFPAFYNKCYYSAIRSLSKIHGFEITDMYYYYSQSNYFSFLVPLFIIFSLYDSLIKFLGLRNLSSYILLVARKK